MTTKQLEQARNKLATMTPNQLKEAVSQIDLANMERIITNKTTTAKIQPRGDQDTVTVVVVTVSRKLKERTINQAGLEDFVRRTLATSDGILVSCSRLAVGPLESKMVGVWYNPQAQGNNKRLTKLLGFPLAGSAIFVVRNGDLSAAQLLQAEALL